MTIKQNKQKFAELSARIPKYLQEKEFAFGEVSCRIGEKSYIYDVAEDLRYIEHRATELGY